MIDVAIIANVVDEEGEVESAAGWAGEEEEEEDYPLLFGARCTLHSNGPENDDEEPH